MKARDLPALTMFPTTLLTILYCYNKRENICGYAVRTNKFRMSNSWICEAHNSWNLKGSKRLSKNAAIQEEIN